jgi:hypothetical protein
MEEKKMKHDDSINRRLRAALRRSGIRQVDAARVCGMSYQHFHRAVSGLRPIYADEVLALAAAAKTDALTLLGKWDQEWADEG